MDSPKKTNGVIFYLTQNTEVRRTYLKTSLYFLFRHFNDAYGYPVVILHEGDYDLKAQEDVLMSIRESRRSLVNFQTLDPADFQLPPHLEAERIKNIIALKPVPYWRSDKYRMMCRWWIKGFVKYATGYDYVMRLDDDSFIEEPIQKEMFQYMEQTGMAYASNLIHTDCAMCCYGMREFFEPYFRANSRGALLDQLFMETKIPMRTFQSHAFRGVLSLNGKTDMSAIGNELTAWSPIIYYNNFFIMDMRVWRQENVQAMVEAIDRNGSIFYYRWGDAPLQTILMSLFAGPDKIERFNFRYSKRMQREAFKGDDGNLHCYMPRHYNESSCITDSISKKNQAAAAAGAPDAPENPA
jgi:hypothetical protein